MRRKFQMLAAMVVLGLTCAPMVFAQAFRPSRPLDIVVHSAPGGGSDVFARAVVEMIEAEKLLDQPLRVVNKIAGASLEAITYLVDKRGDDHTIAVLTHTWL